MLSSHIEKLKNDSLGIELNVACMNPTTKSSLHHIRKLIAKGARPDFMSEEGLNAITSAATFNTKPTVIALLLEHGANIDAQSNGKTALMIAIERGQKNLVQFLLKKNASLHIRDNENRSALDYAKQSNKEIKTLVSQRVHTELLRKYRKHKKDVALSFIAFLQCMRISDSKLPYEMLNHILSYLFTSPINKVFNETTNHKKQTILLNNVSAASDRNSFFYKKSGKQEIEKPAISNADKKRRLT